MLVKELKPSMSGLTLVLKVTTKSVVSTHNGKKHATAVVEDDSGKITLNLWRNQVEQVNVGDTIKLTEAFIHSRGKTLMVSTWSNITVINKQQNEDTTE